MSVIGGYLDDLTKATNRQAAATERLARAQENTYLVLKALSIGLLAPQRESRDTKVQLIEVIENIGRPADPNTIATGE